MAGYKIKINIEFIESDEDVTEIEKDEDGSFSMVLCDADAVSIDKCESSLLQTAYPAIRNALTEHLSTLSKKKPLKIRKLEKE